MTEPQNLKEAPKAKMWQCGDPYKYPIPDQEGNDWERLLEPLLEADKAQCDAWKDEVQNLLIFAGLFSAIVTAFVIDSKASLGPDKEDAIIDALNRIASSSAGTGNIMSAVSEPSLSSSPSSSSVQINIFWFISLILSLTAAIVGIVSLQWLREHQKYPSLLSPKQRFAIFHMRKEGLQRWHVPELFAALSILLQMALVLFLIGMIDLVLAFERKVSIPIIAVIGIPLVFMVTTTVLPALQAFTFCLPAVGASSAVPVQCPYKSPQSNLLRRLLTSSKFVFRIFAGLAYSFHLIIVVLPLQLYNFLRSQLTNEQVGSLRKHDDDSLNRREIVSIAFGGWNAKNWLVYDEEWVRFRDVFARASFDHEVWPSLSNRNLSKHLGPLYDLTKGIADITRSADFNTQFRAYHCVQELSTSVLGEKSPGDSVGDDSKSLLYFQGLLDDQSHPSSTFFSILGEPSREMIQDENAFITLSTYQHAHPQVARHFIELHIRLTNYAYLHPKITFSASSKLTLPDYANSQFLRLYGMGNRRPLKSSGSLFDDAISSQFALTIESFFKVAIDLDFNETTFKSSIYAGGFGDLLTYMAIRQPDDSIQPILKFIAENLNSQPSPRSDFLYYAGSSYARALLISDPYLFRYFEKWENIPAVTAFLRTLKDYSRNRGQPNSDLRTKLAIPDDSDGWWDFLKGNHEARSRRQGTLSRAVSVTLDSESMTIVGSNPDAANSV